MFSYSFVTRVMLGRLAKKNLTVPRPHVVFTEHAGLVTPNFLSSSSATFSVG
jgi:hypothetical protein